MPVIFVHIYKASAKVLNNVWNYVKNQTKISLELKVESYKVKRLQKQLYTNTLIR